MISINRKKKTNLNFAVKISFFLFLLAGCSIAHVPKLAPIERGAVTNLRGGNNAVDLINAQTDKTVRKLGRAGWGTMEGDLYSWTDSAMSLIKTELEADGFKVQANGEKSLKVTVTDAELGVSGIDFVAAVAKCKVGIKVEAGNGYVKTDMDESHALAPLSACDKALMNAVVKVLNDPSLAAYLNP